MIYSSKFEGLKFRPGLSAGFYKTFKFGFNSDFRARYGALYQRLGEKYKRTLHIPALRGNWQGDPIDIPAHDLKVDIDIYFDEIKFPLLLEYHIDNFFLTAGLNAGIVLGGEAAYYKLTPSSNASFSPPEKTLFIKKMDYSASFGCGYRYKNIGVHLIYNHGLRYLDYKDLYASPFESYQRSPFEDRYPQKFEGEDGRLKPRALKVSLDIYFNKLR